MGKSGSPGKLTVSTEEVGDATVVRLEGELDLHGSPGLRSRLKELARGERPLIVVDMAGVPYIDSSGVATLVECLQGVSRYGGTLRLAALGQRARGVFEISRLDTVFDIRPSLEEALQG